MISNKWYPVKIEAQWVDKHTDTTEAYELTTGFVQLAGVWKSKSMEKWQAVAYALLSVHAEYAGHGIEFSTKEEAVDWVHDCYNMPKIPRTVDTLQTELPI